MTPGPRTIALEMLGADPAENGVRQIMARLAHFREILDNAPGCQLFDMPSHEDLDTAYAAAIEALNRADAVLEVIAISAPAGTYEEITISRGDADGMAADSGVK